MSNSPESSSNEVPQRDTRQESAGDGIGWLFAGVGALCDAAVLRARADGAALAVLTQSSHTRELVYATDIIARQLDELQYTIGEGPCVDAYVDDDPSFTPNWTTS